MFEFPDGTVKHVDAAGEESTHFGNGTKLVVTTSSARITTHPNGIVETVGPSGGRMLDYTPSPRTWAAWASQPALAEERGGGAST